MNITKSLLTLAAASIGLFLTPVVASAFTVSHVSSDADYLNLVEEDAFVAEGRIGNNNATNGDYELDIHTMEDSATKKNDIFSVKSQANFSWGNGVAQAFTLAYDAVSNLVSYSVGNRTLNYNPNKSFTDLFIRTRAYDKNATGNYNLLVDNLLLNGQNIFDSSHAAGPNGLDYLRIAGLSGSFTLTGQSTMSWFGNTPTGSNLAYQIKVVSTKGATEVPEPATMSLVSLGAIALGLKTTNRRRQSAIALRAGNRE